MSTSSFSFPPATVTTGATTVGPYDVSQYQVVSVGTDGAAHVGVNLTFEVSVDNVNWYPIVGSNINSVSVVSATGVLTSNSSNAWDIVVGPFSWFRVRSTAYTSGTLNVRVSGGFAAYETSPNVQVANSPTVVLTTSNASAGVFNPAAQAAAGGVTTNHHLVAAATTNATSVKVTAGAIGSIVLANTAAAIKFFKLFNKASAPTVGTDTPVVTVGIPPATTLFWDPAIYYRMTTGIAYAITNLSPDLDATAVTAGDVIVSMQYA